MTHATARFIATLGLALAWAAGWAATGLGIGLASLGWPDLLPWDRFFADVFDAPLPALALPGFLAAWLYAGLRRVLPGDHYAVAALAGAMAGVLLVALPVVTGLASGDLLPRGLTLFIATMSALSGATTQAVRRGAPPRLSAA